jgi:hypothetical protein
MVQAQIHASVIVWKQNASRTSIRLRYDPDLACCKLVRAENPKVVPNRCHIRFHVIMGQITPITARMPLNQTNRMDFVVITERHGCSGDDNLSEFKKRHGDGLTPAPWVA